MRIVLALLTGFLLLGCDSFPTERYTAIQHDGAVYVLNTWTGQISRIDGTSMVSVEETGTGRSRQLRPNAPANLITLLKTPFGAKNMVDLTVKTKRFGSEVLAIGTIHPYLAELQSKIPGIVLDLNLDDADGFQLGSITITLTDMAWISDGRGRKTGWTFAASASISPERYGEVTKISPTWYPALDQSVDAFLETEEGKAWKTKRDVQRRAEFERLIREGRGVFGSRFVG